MAVPIQIMQSINEQARQMQNSSEFLNGLRKICAKHQLVLIAFFYYYNDRAC